MSIGKKFGEIRNAKTGEALVEIIGPGASDDALSIAMRLLTQQLIARGHGGAGGGFFGGTYGYGVDFSNDVFGQQYTTLTNRGGVE